MITCYLRYEVRPDKLAEFEAYGAMWLDLVPRFGGIHHGYFLPSEGESDIALGDSAFRAWRPTNSTARTLARIRMFRRPWPSQGRRAASSVINGPFFRPLLPKTA